MCYHQVQSSSVDAMHEQAQNSVKFRHQPKAHALVAGLTRLHDAPHLYQ